MNRNPFIYLVFLTLSAFIFSCNETADKDNQTSGSIKISVDESYRPIMEEQIKIFQGRFPNARILVEYKPEAECFKDFFEDTTRLIFVTRELSTEEKKYCESKQIPVKSLSVARDAVAFISAADNPKPQFEVKEISDILMGTSKSSYQVVFDNKASSTVRFINDSLLKGKSMSSNIFAANNSEEVINYVANNKNAIGVIGVSWLADHTDSTTESFLSKVQIAGFYVDSMNKYVKPYQAYIGLKAYPFTREFFFISKESWQGLGTGFVNYLCRDGQLVFHKSRMFPVRSNVYLREANVNQ